MIWAFSFEKDLVLKREFGFYVVQASLECMVLLLGFQVTELLTST